MAGPDEASGAPCAVAGYGAGTRARDARVDVSCCGALFERAMSLRLHFALGLSGRLS